MMTLPALKVEQSVYYSEPQECYSASVWWGEILLDFYSPEECRLESERLQEEASTILRLITEKFRPGSEEIITPEELFKAIRTTTICCYWFDFTPAVSMAYVNSIVIPTS